MQLLKLLLVVLMLFSSITDSYAQLSCRIAKYQVHKYTPTRYLVTLVISNKTNKEIYLNAARLKKTYAAASDQPEDTALINSRTLDRIIIHNAVIEEVDRDSYPDVIPSKQRDDVINYENAFINQFLHKSITCNDRSYISLKAQDSVNVNMILDISPGFLYLSKYPDTNIKNTLNADFFIWIEYLSNSKNIQGRVVHCRDQGEIKAILLDYWQKIQPTVDK